jgi:hypothetical protein
MISRHQLCAASRHPRRVLGRLRAHAASWQAGLAGDDGTDEASEPRVRADSEALLLGGIVSGLSLGLAAGVWLGGLRYTTPAGAAVGFALAWALARKSASRRRHELRASRRVP